MDNIRTSLTVFTIVVAGITLATCIGLDANDVNTSADVQGAGNVQAVHDLSDVTADSTATLVPSVEQAANEPLTASTTAASATIVNSGSEAHTVSKPPDTTTSVTTPSAATSTEVATTVAATTPTPETTTTITTPVITTTTVEQAASGGWIDKLLEPLVISNSSVTVAYNRDDWGSGWSDADGDCMSTRHEVLLEESLGTPTLNNSGCQVTGGVWFAAFTGRFVYSPSSLDIDHFVPLANAHASGGWAWSTATKHIYYNNLSDPQHLIAVTASANRSKGSRGPDEWAPPDSSYSCQYADTWVDIKTRWGLTVTASELSALRTMLETCNGVPDSRATTR